MNVAELFHAIVEHTHWTEETQRIAAHEAVEDHFGEKPEVDESAKDGETSNE